MGFDPRDWPSGGRSSRPITGNLDALLQENAALKQEVLRLRRLLDRYERLEREPRTATAKPQWLSHSEAEHWARLLT
jgi:regulator of replication initiation timing